MTPEQFCYWLQGFFEMTGAASLTPQQVLTLRKHLNLVFEDRTGLGTFGMQPDDSPGYVNNPGVECAEMSRDELNGLLSPLGPTLQPFCSPFKRND